MTEAGPDVEDMTFPKSVKKGRARSLNQFYKNLSRKQIQHYFPSILYLVANQRRASDQDSQCPGAGRPMPTHSERTGPARPHRPPGAAHEPVAVRGSGQ